MKQERWQLNRDSAEFYDRYVSLLMEPWVQGLIELAELQPGDRILDVGCGPGFVARRAAEIVRSEGQVVGMDLNESMLIKARKIPPSNSAVPIEWREGDAQYMPFDDSSFDVVLAQQVLQFCPDPKVALQEMRRILAPDGRLALCVWRPLEDNPYPVVQMKVLGRYLGTVVASSLRTAHSMGNAEVLKKLISSVGYNQVEVHSTMRSARVGPVVEFLRGHIAALPFASAAAELSDEALGAMIQDLTRELSDYVVEGILEFPTGAHIVTAYA